MRRFVAAAGACLLSAASGTAWAQSAAAEQTQAQAAIPVGADARIVAPEGWTTARDGGVVRFTPPEGDFHVAIVPVTRAKDAVLTPLSFSCVPLVSPHVAKLPGTDVPGPTTPPPPPPEARSAIACVVVRLVV